MQQSPGTYTEGHFLDWETFREHVISLGVTEEQARADFSAGTEHRLCYHGQTAFIGSTHFQFMARGDILKKIIPVPSEQPMRGERALDVAINEMGLLRLTTEQPYVWHMGNHLTGPVAESSRRRRSLLRSILWLAPIRKVLLWLNNQIFRMYFFNVE